MSLITIERDTRRCYISGVEHGKAQVLGLNETAIIIKVAGTTTTHRGSADYAPAHFVIGSVERIEEGRYQIKVKIREKMFQWLVVPCRVNDENPLPKLPHNFAEAAQV